MKLGHFEMSASSGFARTSDGNIIFRKLERIIVTDRSLNILNQYPVCSCQPGFYFSFSACEFSPGTNDRKYIADLCKECGTLAVIDCSTREKYIGIKLAAGKYSSLCRGTEGTLLVGSQTVNHLLQFKWDEALKELKQIKQYSLPCNGVMYMTQLCSDSSVIVISERNSDSVIALKQDAESPAVSQVWEIVATIASRRLHPYGVTSDCDGRVYVADSKHRRIHVLNAGTGSIIQTLPLENNLNSVFDVLFLSNPPQLLVKHEVAPGAALYNIENE